MEDGEESEAEPENLEEPPKWLLVVEKLIKENGLVKNKIMKH